jgi:hypothetical protein
MRVVAIVVDRRANDMFSLSLALFWHIEGLVCSISCSSSAVCVCVLCDRPACVLVCVVSVSRAIYLRT